MNSDYFHVTPAEGGWYAKFLWHDEEHDTPSVSHYPVVQWVMGVWDYENDPPPEDGKQLPSHCDANVIVVDYDAGVDPIMPVSELGSDSFSGYFHPDHYPDPNWSHRPSWARGLA